MTDSTTPTPATACAAPAAAPTPTAPGVPAASATPAGAPTPPALRAALGRYATGITVVTCRDAAGTAVGLTCNSFAAVSLEPPLVLWSLRRGSASLAAFDASTHFAVSVLSQAQLPLSRRFASPVPDKFAEGAWADGLGGAPVLGDALASFECRVEARHEVGDHVLYIGRVLRLAEGEGAPLLYHGGQYRALGTAV